MERKLSILLTHPVVAAEWHPTKNLPVVVEQVTFGSNKKFWWLGSCGHEWEQAPNARISQNQSCPYCSGRKILEGFNDLGYLRPDLAREWHPTKNDNLSVKMVTEKSSKLVWWLGACGHEWQAKIYSRSNGNNCPKCAHRLTSEETKRGEVLLGEVRPDLKDFWDVILNQDYRFEILTSGSKKNYWWKCKEGHSWESSPLALRKTKVGIVCTICSGKKILKGFNDLATLRPDLASEWHPTKNGNITPDLIGKGTDYVVAWWLGACGHEWETKLTNRTANNHGCPICAGKRVILGINDLATLHPELASEWHPTLNSFAPNTITVSSPYRAWWQCSKKKTHVWQTAIGNRTRFSSGCPNCTQQSSKAENAIAEYLINLLPNIEVVRGDKKILGGLELDILIPDFKLAIEYNGLYWHAEEQGKDRSYHYNKWLKCKENGIQLIQIWEDDWRDKQEFVKRLLAYKLGVHQGSKIPARKTEIVVLETAEARVFLEANHIQGFAAAKYHIGLTFNETLVAVLSVQPQSDGTFIIIRYGSLDTVQGGFSKLLKYIEREHKPQKFMTFSDNTVSDGGLYSSLGFKSNKILAPDYAYIVGGKRQHKFRYRLSKFKKDPTLLFFEGLTEAELAKLNGFDRVWDAGKIRWVKDLG
jgi:hypothetical protein